MSAASPASGDRKISAVMIVQNEAQRLEGSVRACQQFADEIVVVDGGSDDDTVAVARRLGCVVLENPWPGYGPQRNFGADRATHNWVFVVDPDEVVGAELAAALDSWKRSGNDTAAAFQVSTVGDFLGVWLEGASRSGLRLYDRRRCRYTDAQVHETVDVAGHRVSRMPGTLWHYGFRSVSDHIVRFDRYTTLEAQVAGRQGKRFSVWRLVFRPPARFAQKLILHGLYRKGIPGIAVCLLWVYYEIIRELKLRELDWRSSGAPHAPVEPR